MTLHHINVFEPLRGHELGSARRHWERTGDEWRLMLLKNSQGEEND